MLHTICSSCLSGVLQSPLGIALHLRTYSKLAGATQDKISKKKYRVPNPKGEIIFGIFPVILALKNGKRTFHQMYMKDTFQWNIRDDIKQLIVLAEEKSLTVKYFGYRTLNEMSGGRPHQGVCADVSPRTLIPLDNEPEIKGEHKEPRLWLFLDSIKDPMNFGAILRSSYYFGVDRIITTNLNSCGLSPVVSKASAGAMEVLDVHTVKETEEFIQGKIGEGWRVLGTGNVPGIPSMDLNQFSLNKDTLLMLGNEGEGLSPNSSAACQELISILSRRALHPNFDSLNVSVATGILLHHFLGRRVSQ